MIFGMSEKDWKEFFEQEERKMNLGSPRFLAAHIEIMNLIEAAKMATKLTTERTENEI